MPGNHKSELKKAAKACLKYERAFKSEHGRKPTQAEIKNDAAVYKIYKHHAWLKKSAKIMASAKRKRGLESGVKDSGRKRRKTKRGVHNISLSSIQRPVAPPPSERRNKNSKNSFPGMDRDRSGRGMNRTGKTLSPTRKQKQAPKNPDDTKGKPVQPTPTAPLSLETCTPLVVKVPEGVDVTPRNQTRPAHRPLTTGGRDSIMMSSRKRPVIPHWQQQKKAAQEPDSDEDLNEMLEDNADDNEMQEEDSDDDDQNAILRQMENDDRAEQQENVPPKDDDPAPNDEPISRLTKALNSARDKDGFHMPKPRAKRGKAAMSARMGTRTKSGPRKMGKSARKNASVSQNFVRLERGKGCSYSARRNRSKGQSGRKRTVKKHKLDKFGNPIQTRAYKWQQKKEMAEKANDNLYTELLDEKPKQMGESDDEDTPIMPANYGGGNRSMSTPKAGPRGELPPTTPLAPPTPYGVPPTPANGATIDRSAMTVHSYEGLSDEDLEAKMYEALKANFKHSDFRPGQKKTVMKILRGEPTLLILPTGGGKSLTFQLPAVMLGGLTLVITPLISLMKDQAESLPDAVTGAVWNSAHAKEDNWQTIVALREGRIQVLFISPERLFSASFQRVITRLSYPVTFACVDEAHCVSEWSHNFRPAYLRIQGVLKDIFHVKRVLALTATATQLTTTSVMKSLGLPKENLVRVTKSRDNLHLTISRENNNMRALLSMITSPRFKKLEGGFIVYVSYIREATSLVTNIRTKIPKTHAYHGKLPPDQRAKIQDDFMANKIKVVVATIAFGMGLDKQDVSAVIHYNCPRTFEHYVQEVGRAGRDGNPAECHCFFREKHLVKMRSLIYSDGLDQAQIRDVLALIFGSKSRPGQAGDFVGVARDKIGARWDVGPAIIGTLLSRLEIDHDVVKVHPDLHDKVKIGFCERNGDKKCGEAFKTFAKMLEMLNPRGGYYFPRVTQWATWCGVEIVDIQRDIMDLKRRRLITVKWDDRSYCVKLLKGQAEVDRDDLVRKLSKYFHDTEALALEKVNAIAQAMKATSCDTYHEAENDTKNSERLHELVEGYFKCQNSAEFVQQLDSMCDEADRMGDTEISEKHFMYKELRSDASAFVCQHREIPARAIARIFHGMSSPQYPYRNYCKNPFWEKHLNFPFKQLLSVVRRVRAPLMSKLIASGTRRKIKEDVVEMDESDRKTEEERAAYAQANDPRTGRKRKSKKGPSFLDFISDENKVRATEAAEVERKAKIDDEARKATLED